MKRIVQIAVLIIALFASPNIKAQYIDTGFWGGVELDYGLSLGDKGTGFNHKFGGKTRMQTVSVRSIMGYYIVPTFSVGTGVGLSTYSKQRVNTIPLFLDFRIHPLAKLNENFYVNINIGTFLGDNQDHIDSQFFWEASVGYKLFDFGNFNLAPAIGYQMYKYRTDMLKENVGTTLGYVQRRRTLFFRLSLTY